MKRYGQKGGHASLWFEKGMMETTTLTLMGIFANFAISYAANNVPTLRDLINRKKGLGDRIDECFKKALKRWSVNRGVRDINVTRQVVLAYHMVGREHKHA